MFWPRGGYGLALAPGDGDGYGDAGDDCDGCDGDAGDGADCNGRDVDDCDGRDGDGCGGDGRGCYLLIRVFLMESSYVCGLHCNCNQATPKNGPILLKSERFLHNGDCGSPYRNLQGPPTERS